MDYKKEFIRFMVRSKALMFGEFITKSGRTSPYFINTGKYETGHQITQLGYYYAKCIRANINSGQIDRDINTLFGPAYKGIPLAVSTLIALANSENESDRMDINYCFNRKEVKDHGEGGSIVGFQPGPDDKILIIEDVITAGTAVRETLPLLKAQGNPQISGLIVSVDRMEKSIGDKTAVQSLYEEEGIPTFPIVNIRDIINELHNNPVDGKIYIDNNMKYSMEEYLDKWGSLSYPIL